MASQPLRSSVLQAVRRAIREAVEDSRLTPLSRGDQSFSENRTISNSGAGEALTLSTTDDAQSFTVSFILQPSIPRFLASAIGGGTFSSLQITNLGINFVLSGAGLAINSNTGTSGQVLTSQGPGTPPIWAAAGGSASLPQFQGNSTGNPAITPNTTSNTAANTVVALSTHHADTGITYSSVDSSITFDSSLYGRRATFHVHGHVMPNGTPGRAEVVVELQIFNGSKWSTVARTASYVMRNGNMNEGAVTLSGYQVTLGASSAQFRMAVGLRREGSQTFFISNFTYMSAQVI